MRRAWLAATALMLALACNQVNVCRWTRSPVVDEGGAAVQCLSSDDCPREGNALVCHTTVEPDRTCVECVQGACERVVAEPCP